MKTLFRSFALFFSLCIVGCAPPLPSKGKIIIGDNEMLTLEDSIFEASLGRAIGITSNNCTIFHLGKGLSATAGHCFDVGQKIEGRFPCIETTIRWGFTKSNNASFLESRCIEILEYQNNDLKDFALVRVDPFPDKAFSLAEGKRHEDYWVVGHPKGGFLHVSGPSKLTPKGAYQFSHVNDTQKGHSGSPILDIDLRVIGIHNGGSNEQNYGTFIEATSAIDLKNAKASSLPDGQISFGPMGHSQSVVLFNVPTSQAGLASLNLLVDIEDGYDVVKYVDGAGNLRSLTGKKNIRLHAVETPVVVVFESDYAGASKKIDITDIELY